MHFGTCIFPSGTCILGICPPAWIGSYKSRTTAITRANSLLKFLRWRAECSDNDGKPFPEQEAWQYLREMRESGAAPTKGQVFYRLVHTLFMSLVSMTLWAFATVRG